MPRHYISIDINWIDRIGNRDLILPAQNIENVTAVAFRAIRQENFVTRDFDSAIEIIKLCDFAPEKFVALFGARGNGSVTSPIPQRINRLAASGFSSENWRTRRAISGNK